MLRSAYPMDHYFPRSGIACCGFERHETSHANSICYPKGCETVAEGTSRLPSLPLALRLARRVVLDEDRLALDLLVRHLHCLVGGFTKAIPRDAFVSRS